MVEGNPRPGAHQEAAELLHRRFGHPGAAELRPELRRGELAASVQGAEERGGSRRRDPEPAPERFSEPAVVDPEGVEPLGADGVEHEGGRAQDLRLRLDARHAEDIQVELTELPGPAGLGFFVAPEAAEREPLDRDRFGLRPVDEDPGERWRRFGGQGDLPVPLVPEGPELVADLLAALDPEQVERSLRTVSPAPRTRSDGRRRASGGAGASGPPRPGGG